MASISARLCSRNEHKLEELRAALPGWKLAVGIAVLAVLAAILVVVAMRAWDALGRIAAAFWTMALTLFTLLAFVIAAGLFSRGFQWVVASMPDKLGVGAL